MFEAIGHYEVDPIMAAAGRFAADPRDNKINLTVGVYQDASGTTPIFDAVKEAELRLQRSQTTKTYRALTGDPEFCDALAAEIFGASLPASEHLSSVQTAGGAVALKVVADLLADLDPKPKVWLQTPFYGNHSPILEAAGANWGQLPYYNAATQKLQFEELIAAIDKLPTGNVFLLQGPCHNPSGADMSEDQWDTLLDLMHKRGVVPWLDIAYLGFGQGLTEDCAALRKVADKFEEFLVCISLSKSFGLYRDRAGAIYLRSNKIDRATVMQAFTSFVRPASSHAPDHGAAVAKLILGDDGLRQVWLDELETMRKRVMNLRQQIVAAAQEHLGTDELAYIKGQSGMFSLLPMNRAQVERLVEDYKIYIVQDGRINVARINPTDLPRIMNAIKAVWMP